MKIKIISLNLHLFYTMIW